VGERGGENIYPSRTGETSGPGGKTDKTKSKSRGRKKDRRGERKVLVGPDKLRSHGESNLGKCSYGHAGQTKKNERDLNQ